MSLLNDAVQEAAEYLTECTKSCAHVTKIECEIGDFRFGFKILYFSLINGVAASCLKAMLVVESRRSLLDTAGDVRSAHH